MYVYIYIYIYVCVCVCVCLRVCLCPVIYLRKESQVNSVNFYRKNPPNDKHIYIVNKK